MPPLSTTAQLLLVLLAAAIRPAAAIPATPTAKTTVSTTCTTSSTTHNSLLDLGYPGYDTMTRIATTTTTIIEPPLPAPPPTITANGPVATVLETHMVAGTDTTYLVRSKTSTSTRFSAWSYTTTRTWIVHPFTAQPGSAAPAPAAPAAAGPTPVCPETSCANPSEEADKVRSQREAADSRCAARNMETGCQAQQCQARRAGEGGEGGDNYYHWWCLRISQMDFVFPELRMGRSCWSAADNSFMQLNAPCLAADYQAGCRPCRGRDLGWNGANWIEPPL
ncbi:hypothetical protein PpBr36_01935 [Pyricularia pennisetigena]|uniref:hypothetical protein n=1 Tax=Pyricularia pennisetigena TaxID=1578925 RepID=UPI00114D8BD8|nr:hypothetical protein PpBr36_01935 [Pyricularia pennisetigena]TLS28658.1 hypothetical protein PpBr36_01935 [Pyricularia pennisetigena]